MPLQERNCSCIFLCGILAGDRLELFRRFTVTHSSRVGWGGGGAIGDKSANLVHKFLLKLSDRSQGVFRPVG